MFISIEMLIVLNLLHLKNIELLRKSCRNEQKLHDFNEIYICTQMREIKMLKKNYTRSKTPHNVCFAEYNIKLFYVIYPRT